MLDDLLTLFRRRRSPARRRKPPADSLWGINLSTLGGLIGLGRPDRIPRTGPAMKQPRRAYQETDDWQPAPSYAQPAAAQAAQYAQPQPDPNADWQAAQYAQHAEPARAAAHPPAPPPSTGMSSSSPISCRSSSGIISPPTRWKKPSATARS